MKRTVTRRKLFSLMGMSTAITMLAACAPKAVETTPAPAVSEPARTAAPAATAALPQKEKQVVRFTMYGHPNLAEEMVDRFNETHEGIQVQFERSEGQGYEEKLAAALAGGGAWDCFRADRVFATRFGPKGALLDLTPFEEADTVYPEDLYIPGALDVWNVGGKRYGLPGYCMTMWLYYNKKLFDEASVPYPTEKTTWEEYVEMCKALTKTDSNGMITQYGANGWGSWTLPVAQDVWSAGGCFYYNNDLTAICMDDPLTIKVLQDEADLMNVYKVHPSSLNPPTTPATLLSKKVATQIDGDWYPWDQRDQWSEDFDATLTPLRDGKRLNCYMPDAFVVNSASKVPEGAYRWISWFAADPESSAIQGKVIFLVTKRAYEDVDLREKWLTTRPPTMQKLALESMQNMRLWRVEPHASEFENTIYTPEIDRLWRNKATAEEVCKAITQKGNELMAKPIE